MFRFLLKGILRDRRRSLLPAIVVTIGVLCIVSLDGIIGGMMESMIRLTSNFQTGHVRVVTREYVKEDEQKPLDLALTGAGSLLEELHRNYPSVDWAPRIFFGGLLDIPDERGETKAQGPVVGQALDLLTAGSKEAERMGLSKALTEGKLISRQKEIMVSIDFAEKLGVKPNDTVTFFGATMYGSMAFQNYVVAGIVRFGTGMLDKGAIILDLADARLLLDMEDAAGEIFGFFPENIYDDALAGSIKQEFNTSQQDNPDEYAPEMFRLTDLPLMSQMMGYTRSVSMGMLILMVISLSIVLWNTGILGGIRRYNEFGMRLALGEEKRHIYRTLLNESIIIGLIGSVAGTLCGLFLSLLLSRYGLDYSASMENVSLMIDPVVRAKITPRMYFIGFIPGLLAMFIGTALAGRAIYKRNTATLFKENEK